MWKDPSVTAVCPDILDCELIIQRDVLSAIAQVSRILVRAVIFRCLWFVSFVLNS